MTRQPEEKTCPVCGRRFIDKHIWDTDLTYCNLYCALTAKARSEGQSSDEAKEIEPLQRAQNPPLTVNIIIGDGNITGSGNFVSGALSPATSALVKIYNRLDPAQKARLLVYADMLYKEEQTRAHN